MGQPLFLQLAPNGGVKSLGAKPDQLSLLCLVAERRGCIFDSWAARDKEGNRRVAAIG